MKTRTLNEHKLAETLRELHKRNPDLVTIFELLEDVVDQRTELLEKKLKEMEASIKHSIWYHSA